MVERGRERGTEASLRAVAAAAGLGCDLAERDFSAGVSLSLVLVRVPAFAAALAPPFVGDLASDLACGVALFFAFFFASPVLAGLDAAVAGLLSAAGSEPAPLAAIGNTSANNRATKAEAPTVRFPLPAANIILPGRIASDLQPIALIKLTKP